jgi:hypothetical protein
MMLTCLAILGLYLCGTPALTIDPAQAQTCSVPPCYGQAQWGVQQGTTTPNVVIFDGVQNVPIGQLNTTTHTWTPATPTPTFPPGLTYPSAILTGNFGSAGGTQSITNIYSSPPVNAWYASGAGAVYSYCSVGGCVAGDHLRGEQVQFMTTSQDATIQESAMAVNITSLTGHALIWKSGVATSAGTQVESNSNIYQALNSNTTGASAPACGSWSCSDGSVTWQYLGPEINQGKEGVSIAAHITSTGSPAWALDTSCTIDSGAGLQVGYFCNEFDTANNNVAGTPGVANSATVFFENASAFPVTALLWDAGGSSATYSHYYTIFEQWANSAQAAVIKDNSSATYGYDDSTGTHTVGGYFEGTYGIAGVISAGVIDIGIQASVPTTGQTVIIGDHFSALVVAPAGTLSALTIQLPTCSVSYNGKITRFMSTQAVTTLTVTATAGSIVGAPASMTVNSFAGFACYSASTSWYRIS